jgi:homoserine dehydrogenase
MASHPVRQIRLLLVGAGNVGRRFLELLVLKSEWLRNARGLEFLVDLKIAGRGVAADPAWGRPGVPALEMACTAPADLLLEASPAHLADGQPGLGIIEAALSRGLHVVTANKPPLVLAFPRLLALARSQGVQLRFDATVAGGLPAVNLGERDLAGAHIHTLEGILNLTANYILARMAEGLPYGHALAEAQAAGHAEADPSLDVDGWDAAQKLVILSHSVLGHPAVLGDVEVEGIAGVTPDLLRQANAQGKRIRLLATAEQGGASYRLRVAPAWLGAEHPLAQLGPEEMGIVFHTDVCGRLRASIVEESPTPTAFAMLRDVLCIYAP